MSSAQGRWTSPDRINVTNQRLLMPSNTLNKYVYAANNPLKYVDPNGEDITVFVKKNMTHPRGHWVGHAMLGVHNQATGEVRFLDYFPRDGSRPVGKGVNAGADLTLDRLRQHASLTIQTSPEVAQKAIELIDKLTKDPGTYWLVGNNCTDTCENILRELGLYGGDVFTPDDFWDRVSEKYGNKPHVVPGTGARIYPYAPGQEFGNPRIQGIDYVRLLFYMLESQRNAAASKPAPKKKDYEVDVNIRYDIP